MSELGIREQLVGCWRLVGYSVTAAEGGETDRPLGNSPLGTILYTPDGYMSAQLSRPGPSEDDQEPGAYYYVFGKARSRDSHICSNQGYVARTGC